MQEVKISLQIGEITHEIGEKNNTANSTRRPEHCVSKFPPGSFCQNEPA